MKKRLDREDYKKLSFEDALEKVADTLDLKKSARITREGFGKLIDLFVFLRQSFQQSWQFVVIIQAMWIFLGLSDDVGVAIENLLGITVSGTWWGIIAVAGVIGCLILGLLLLIYGGSQRHSFLVNQRQNPAEALNYRSYQLILDKLDELEKKLEEQNTQT